MRNLKSSLYASGKTCPEMAAKCLIEKRIGSGKRCCGGKRGDGRR